MIKRNLPLMITLGVFVLGYLYCLTQFPGFASTRVICNILTDNAFLGIIAVGMTFVILSGGIDLSVGSVIAFTGVFLAKARHRLLGHLAAGGLSAGAGDGLRVWRLYGAADRRVKNPGLYHYPRGDVLPARAAAIWCRRSRFRLTIRCMTRSPAWRGKSPAAAA